ncbi:MAG: 8-oxo-dGTP diphosphatase [Candidatus Woesearchaeota archaeon]
MREATLVFPIRDGSVLLGLKKRGFAQGLWNGFGGKIGDETVEEAAVREVEEECGLLIDPSSLEPRGVLDFSLPDLELRVHVFRAKRFSGSVTESEEMKPEWYRFEDIPYDLMWEDDRHWLPYVLSGKSVSDRFVYEGSNIVSIDLRIR